MPFSRWTSHEDELLKQALCTNRGGHSDQILWTKVSLAVGKSVPACKSRMKRFGILKEQWDPCEVSELCSLCSSYQQHDKPIDFKQVSIDLGTKPAYLCRRKWQVLCKTHSKRKWTAARKQELLALGVDLFQKLHPTFSPQASQHMFQLLSHT